jgi:hypothetical protein
MSTEAEVRAQATRSYANVTTSSTVSFTYKARARLMRPVMQMASARRRRRFDLDQQGVAVLPGGALVPAPSGSHQQGTPPWELPGSKQEPPWVSGQGRRDDPQAVSGRLAWGERLANPTPQSIVHLLKRGRTI